MKYSRLCVLPVILAGFVCYAQRAQAQTDIVNTLSNPPLTLTDGPGITTGAQQFMTDTIDRTLTSVTLGLRGSSSDIINVALYSDAAGLPGANLLSLGTATPTSTNVFTDITLNPGSPFTLSASTTYWIVGQYTAASDWGSSDTTTSTGVGTIGLFSFSTTSGSSWEGPFSGSPYLVAVSAESGVATPEPGSSSLLASMFVLAAFAGKSSVGRRRAARRRAD